MDDLRNGAVPGGKGVGVPVKGKLFAGGDPLAQRMKSSSEVSKPARPVTRPVVSKPVQPSARPVTNRPAQPVVNKPAQPASRPVTPSSAGSSTTRKAEKPKKANLAKDAKNKKTIFVGIGALVALVLIVLVVVLVVSHGNGEDSDGGVVASFEDDSLTEEEKVKTEEVVSKYAELKVEGMEEYEDELGKHNAVIVTLKNVSEETVSIAVELGAYDKEGNLLDKSSLYAEGIAPEQMYSFQTFVYSKLSRETLEASDIKVHKAYTYIPAGSGETVEVEDSVEVVLEVSE